MLQITHGPIARGCSTHCTSKYINICVCIHKNTLLKAPLCPFSKKAYSDKLLNATTIRCGCLCLIQSRRFTLAKQESSLESNLSNHLWAMLQNTDRKMKWTYESWTMTSFHTQLSNRSWFLDFTNQTCAGTSQKNFSASVKRKFSSEPVAFISAPCSGLCLNNTTMSTSSQKTKTQALDEEKCQLLR